MREDMMEHRNKIHTRHKSRGRLFLAAALALGFLFMLYGTKSSPLYPMNDNCDLNIFKTMGRGILDGIVPYRDLYEQKGPLLFFLHALLSLFFPGSYLGDYLLESLLFGLFLYYCGRITALYVKNPLAPWLSMLFLATVLPCSRLFHNSGTIEQLFLFALPLSLFPILRAIREGRLLNFREGFLIGTLAAMGFWTKYTFSGFFGALALFVVLWYISRRQAGEVPRAALSMLEGFAAISLPLLLYFAANRALGDLFDVYFRQNMTAYARRELGPLAYISQSLSYVYHSNLKIFSWTFWPGAGLLLFGFLKHWRESLAVLLSFLGLAVTTYCCSPGYTYYGLILAPFALTGVVGILMGVEAVLCVALRKIPFWQSLRQSHNLQSRRATAILLTVFLLLAAGGVWLVRQNAPDAYLLGYKIEDFPQYQFGQIMRQKPQATMLHYYALDNGFYFMGNARPVNRYFCYFNINPPELLPEQQAVIEKREVDFVVALENTLPKKILEKSGYRMVKQMDFPFGNANYSYYLYKKIE